MTSFVEQAERLALQLESELAEGRRNARTDTELELLRSAWRQMDSEGRRSASEAVGRIATLVTNRPPEPALPDNLRESEVAPERSSKLREPTAGQEEHPPIPEEPHWSAGDSSGRYLGEEAEAALALQGLERIEEDKTVPVRYFNDTADPDLLLAHMGYDEYRPGQRDAVGAALNGQDCLIVMPTGGGKSLCYQLPGLAGTDLTLVVSPLIALMADQVRRLRP